MFVECHPELDATDAPSQSCGKKKKFQVAGFKSQVGGEDRSGLENPPPETCDLELGTFNLKL
jgi:hypothetical protein